MNNKIFMLLSGIMPVLLAFAAAFMWLGRLDAEVDKLSVTVTPEAFKRYGALVREVEGQREDIGRLERALDRFRDRLDSDDGR